MTVACSQIRRYEGKKRWREMKKKREGERERAGMGCEENEWMASNLFHPFVGNGSCRVCKSTVPRARAHSPGCTLYNSNYMPIYSPFYVGTNMCLCMGACVSPLFGLVHARMYLCVWVCKAPRLFCTRLTPEYNGIPDFTLFVSPLRPSLFFSFCTPVFKYWRRLFSSRQ